MNQEYLLPITVTFQVRVVESNGKTYVRTRDIADVLGIKQPFEFTKDIKEALGVDTILKGDDTIGMREDRDNSRTPYIRVSHMIDFLEKGIVSHQTNGTTQEVIEVLNQYMNLK